MVTSSPTTDPTYSSDTKNLPRLLVVFPCLNEEAYLENTVRFILKDLLNTYSRLVIVDGGSSDKSILIAQKLAEENPLISFIKNPKKLQSAAINLAVETFGNAADYLIRIDVHADYPHEYCQKLVSEALAFHADSVVVSLNTVGNGNFQKATAIAQNSLLGNGGADHRRQSIEGYWVEHGHHALMSIHAFRSVGGYDEDFSHNEDAELDYRLIKAGYKIWLTRLAIVTYYPRSTPFALFLQYYNYGYGRARNILKNHIRPKARQIIPILVVPFTALACLAPLHWTFIIPLTLWGVICLSYGLWLGTSKQFSTALLVGLSAMIMHWSWSLGFLHFIVSRKRK